MKFQLRKHFSWSLMLTQVILFYSLFLKFDVGKSNMLMLGIFASCCRSARCYHRPSCPAHHLPLMLKPIVSHLPMPSRKVPAKTTILEAREPAAVATTMTRTWEATGMSGGFESALPWMTWTACGSYPVTSQHCTPTWFMCPTHSCSPSTETASSYTKGSPWSLRLVEVFFELFVKALAAIGAKASD